MSATSPFLPSYHSLPNTEINFLYELYKTTQKEECRTVAGQLLQAVRDTPSDWINRAGDLHYAIYPNGAFSRKDDPVLTLRDLRYTQQWMTELEGRRDPPSLLAQPSLPP